MTNNSAVFSEVLSLTVQSEQFAAEMAKVEAIYEASLTKMQSAQLEANGLGNVTQQAQQAANAFEAFGTAFERALIRIPARMAAMATVLAALSPAIAAIYDLTIGFENLEQHSPDFQKTEASLKALNSEFASIAATPVFDYVLEQMHALSGWLQENKVYVDNLALSLGNVVTGVMKAMVELAKSDVVKDVFKGFAVVVNDLALALGTVVNEITLLFNLLTAKGADQSVWQHLKNTVTQPFASIEKDGWFGEKAKDIQGIIDKSAEAQAALIKNHQLFEDSLNGTANQDIPAVPTGDQRTLADMKAEFQDKLAATKEYYEAVRGVVKTAVADHVMSHQAAAPILKSYIDAEQNQVNVLIQTYKDLATVAKGAKGDQIQKAQESYDKTGHNEGKAFNSERAVAERAANAERIADEKIFSEAKLKILEGRAKAELAIIKKLVADGRLTHLQGNEADSVDEARRHKTALDEISNRAAAPDSREAAQKQVALDEENARNKRTITALAIAHTEAVKADSTAVDANNASLTRAKEAVVSANLETAKALGHKREEMILTRELIALKLQEAEIELASKKADADKDGNSPAGNRDRAEVANLQAKVQQLQAELHRASESGTALGHTLGGDQLSNGDQLKQNLGLDKMSQDMQAASEQTDATTRALGQFAAGLEGAVGIMKGLTDAVDGAIAGYRKAGAMGAASSLLQDKNVESGLGSIAGMASKSLGNMVPVIGPMIGQMFGMVTGLFQAGIETMVTNINNQVQAINLAAQTKQIGIAQQIAELKAEEMSAIQALGGKKKAATQLKSILQSLNTEIANLQFQAQQTIQQFNDMVSAGSLGNMTGIMASWATSWEQINQQVEAYVQAGGSIATAAEYMNQQLKQQRQQLQDQLNQGNQTAISDALQLNKLEQQKVDMMKQEAATEFGMLNSDSIERRTASAVTTGIALTVQRNAFAQQLLDLNNQITLGQEKIAIESKVFDLNQSIASLQANSNALTIASLNQQLLKYQDMQALVKATNGMVFSAASINPGAGLNGTQAPIPGEPGVAGAVIQGGVNITVNGSISETGAVTLASEIASNIRSGRTTFSTTGQ
jgi:hypothetical protein